MDPTDNLSAVLHGVNDLRIEHFLSRDPNAGEIQLRIQNCGMCMTDVHLLDNGCLGNMVLKTPCVIGHELSGTVTKVGPDVSDLQPGARVAVDPLVPCGRCVQCRRGRANTCHHQTYVGFGCCPSVQGGLAQLATFPAVCFHRIPDSMDFEEAALMEPLAVCVNAARRADVSIGDNVIVFGAGPIGLMTSQVVLAMGATSVCVTDIDSGRLELARSLGATHTVLFGPDETDAQANAQKLRQAFDGDIDVAMECSGVSLCLQTSVYAVRPTGVVAVVGLGADDVTIPINDAVVREIDIRGCICNNNCFPLAIGLVASGKVKVKPIVSHRLHLKDVPKAIQLLRNRQVVKIMIDCSWRRTENGIK